MYLWVGGAGALRLLRLPWLTSIAIATLCSVVILWPMTRGEAPALALMVKGFFAAGAIACLLRKHIRISTGILLALVAVALLASRTVHAAPFSWLMVTYFVFWFAYVPRLPAMPYRMDLSYGIYIWAWPIQQSVVTVAGVHEPLAVFAIVMPIILAVAALSWFCIEKPALRLKDWRWRARQNEPQPSRAEATAASIGWT